ERLQRERETRDRDRERRELDRIAGLKTVEEVLQELTKTEEVYGKELRVMIEFIMQPMEYESVLGSEDAERVFGNVLDVYSLTLKIGEEVEEWNNYIKYVENHALAMKTLAKFDDAKGTPEAAPFLEFCKRCQARPECNGNDIRYFLSLPLYRMGRYVALLTRLRDMVGKESGTEESIDAAVAFMSQLGNLVEELMRPVPTTPELQSKESSSSSKQQRPLAASSSSTAAQSSKKDALAFFNAITGGSLSAASPPSTRMPIRPSRSTSRPSVGGTASEEVDSLLHRGLAAFLGHTATNTTTTIVDEAVGHWKQALKRAFEDRDVLRESVAMSNIGAALVDSGKPVEGLALVVEAWERTYQAIKATRKEGGDSSRTTFLSMVVDNVSIEGGIGKAYRLQSQSQQQQQQQDDTESLLLPSTIGPPLMIVMISMATNIANAHVRLEQMYGSVKWYTAGLKLVDVALRAFPLPPAPGSSSVGGMGHFHMNLLLCKVRSCVMLALSQEHSNQFENAEESFQQASQTLALIRSLFPAPASTANTSLTEVDKSVLRVEALYAANWGNFLNNRGLLVEAIEQHVKAAGLFRQIGDVAGYKREMINLGCLRADVGKALDTMRWLKSVDARFAAAIEAAEIRTRGMADEGDERVGGAGVSAGSAGSRRNSVIGGHGGSGAGSGSGGPSSENGRSAGRLLSSSAVSLTADTVQIGQVYTATREFRRAKGSDLEIDVRVGDRVRVAATMLDNDGMALGTNMRTQLDGTFPLACLASNDVIAEPSSISSASVSSSSSGLSSSSTTTEDTTGNSKNSNNTDDPAAAKEITVRRILFGKEKDLPAPYKALALEYRTLFKNKEAKRKRISGIWGPEALGADALLEQTAKTLETEFGLTGGAGDLAKAYGTLPGAASMAAVYMMQKEPVSALHSLCELILKDATSNRADHLWKPVASQAHVAICQSLVSLHLTRAELPEDQLSKLTPELSAKIRRSLLVLENDAANVVGGVISAGAEWDLRPKPLGYRDLLRIVKGCIRILESTRPFGMVPRLTRMALSLQAKLQWAYSLNPALLTGNPIKGVSPTASPVILTERDVDKIQKEAVKIVAEVFWKELEELVVVASATRSGITSSTAATFAQTADMELRLEQIAIAKEKVMNEQQQQQQQQQQQAVSAKMGQMSSSFQQWQRSLRGATGSGSAPTTSAGAMSSSGRKPKTMLQIQLEILNKKDVNTEASSSSSESVDNDFSGSLLLRAWAAHAERLDVCGKCAANVLKEIGKLSLPSESPSDVADALSTSLFATAIPCVHRRREGSVLNNATTAGGSSSSSSAASTTSASNPDAPDADTLATRISALDEQIRQLEAERRSLVVMKMRKDQSSPSGITRSGRSSPPLTGLRRSQSSSGMVTRPLPGASGWGSGSGTGTGTGTQGNSSDAGSRSTPPPPSYRHHSPSAPGRRFG
ncbi:hypothetical protein HK102_002743, partial [Quaeritorhiza haematococci]